MVSNRRPRRQKLTEATFRQVIEKERRINLESLERALAHARRSRAATVRLQRILNMTYEIFQNEENAARWLLHPAFGLAGKVPISVAATPKGFKNVRHILMSIVHGLPV